MKHRNLIRLFAVFVLVASCSVKEDRTECPLYVSVLSQTESDCLVSFFASDGSLLDSRLIAAEDIRSGNNRTELPRKDFYVSVLKNKWDMAFRGNQVVYCRSGREAAPVYAFSAGQFLFDAHSDELTVKGVLKKQYAMVSISFTSREEAGFHYHIAVSGRSNGFNLVTLEKEEGRYLIEPEINGTLQTEFAITRQSSEDPILLSIIDDNTDEVVTIIDIGDYIVKAGYDWKAESLGDIGITVDCTQMIVDVKISDWENKLIEILEEK